MQFKLIDLSIPPCGDVDPVLAKNRIQGFVPREDF